MRGVAFVVAVLLSIALAEQHRLAGDHAAALRAYIEAVEADPAVAGLERIRRYAVPQDMYRQQQKETKEPHIAALRQYLQLHPDDRDAAADLVLILPPRPPLRVGGDVKSPVVVTRVAPVYPEEAKKAGISGIVMFDVVIDKDGRLTKTTLLKGLPYGLNAAAEAALKQWTFRPGTLLGEPVEVVYTLSVVVKEPPPE